MSQRTVLLLCLHLTMTMTTFQKICSATTRARTRKMSRPLQTGVATKREANGECPVCRILSNESYFFLRTYRDPTSPLFNLVQISFPKEKSELWMLNSQATLQDESELILYFSTFTSIWNEFLKGEERTLDVELSSNFTRRKR